MPRKPSTLQPAIVEPPMEPGEVYERIGFKPRRHQAIIDNTESRFTVLVCHRRFGKTVLTVARLFREILSSPNKNPRGLYICPTYQMGKKIAWDYMLEFASRIPGSRVNKVTHAIDFANGGRISLGSSENPDSNRGVYFDMIAVDEPAFQPTRIFSEILRPALADRNGSAVFLGTPSGRSGMLWDLWNFSQLEPDWSRFMFKASETKIIPEKELRAAAKTMSKAEYAQEWECSFSAAIKGAYMGEACNQAEGDGRILDAVAYDPMRPVHAGLCTGSTQENACWFFQFSDDGYVNFLRFERYPSASIADIVKAWRELPYKVIYKVVIPRPDKNDAGRAERFRGFGYRVIEPDETISFTEAIETARGYIGRSRFHWTDTRHGMECLRQFRQEYDERNEVYKPYPVKNWTVAAADAYRYISICHRRLSKRHREPDYSAMDRAVAWG